MASRREAPAPLAHDITTNPAPIGGLNLRDSLANMPATDAVNLVNWIPDSYGVRCRNGYSEWAINFVDDPIKSVFPYFAADTTFPGGSFLTAPTVMPGFLFAADDNDIYDITTSTDTPASVQALSGNLDAGLISSCMLANTAGAWLAVCSEADGYFTFDGTAWVQVPMGAGAAEISGVDPATFVHVSEWKERLWFVQRDSTDVWYLSVNSVYGAAVKLPLGAQLKRGGHISWAASWTIDAGEGIDDFLVFCSSNGELLVYKGTDPASASTFGLVGRWTTGQVPVGRRGYCQYGGDLLIVSTDGVTPLSAVTRGGTTFLVTNEKDYSSKVRPGIGREVQASFTTVGWQLYAHPASRLLICSVPDHGTTVNLQFVMSTSINAWCYFNDVPINCMGSTGSYLFAGTQDGRVLLLFNAALDNILYDGTEGVAIHGQIVPAYSYFGAPALSKMFYMARPSFLSVQEPGVLLEMAVDFEIPADLGTATFVLSAQALWDIANWDQAIWAGGERPYASWVTVTGEGYAGALAMSTACVGGATLVSIDFMTEKGGPF